MSKNKRPIRNIDTLEKEIYRLKSEARQIEDKLDSNFDHFQHHYASMAMNSLFQRSSGKENIKEKFFNSILENEKISNGIDTIFDYLVAKAAEGIEFLLDKIQNRNK